MRENMTSQISFNLLAKKLIPREQDEILKNLKI